MRELWAEGTAVYLKRGYDFTVREFDRGFADILKEVYG